MVKNCDRGLENTARGRTPYGPPSRQITYISVDKYAQRAKLILSGPSEFSISPEREISSGRKNFCFSDIGLTEITNKFIMAVFEKKWMIPAARG